MQVLSEISQPKQSPDGKGVRSPSPEVFNSRGLATWQGYSGAEAELNVLWAGWAGPDLPDVEQVVRLLANEVGVEQQVAITPEEMAQRLGIHRYQL